MISVEFELADLVDCDVDIKEERGRVRFLVNRDLTPEEIVEALNEAAAAVLRGGHWFQEWHGDIVTMATPDEQGPSRISRLHVIGVTDKSA